MFYMGREANEAASLSWACGPMEFEYHIDTEKGFITEWFRGEICLEDICVALQIVQADPHYDPHFNGLVDLQEAMLEIRFADMMRLLDKQVDSPRTSKGRWAFIATDPNNYGTMRMYKSVTDVPLGLEVNLFTTEEEALAWCASLGGGAARRKKADGSGGAAGESI